MSNAALLNANSKFVALNSIRASITANDAPKSVGSMREVARNIVSIRIIAFANDVVIVAAVMTNAAVTFAAVCVKVADIPAICASKFAFKFAAEAVAA